MKSKITLVILFSLIFNSYELFSQCANPSNVYSFTYEGKNYELIKEMKSWVNASACAVERGGYLVEIDDVNEQTAVYNAIISSGVNSKYTSIANGGGIAYIWIGATDQSNEGTWLWNGNNDNTGINFWTGQGSNGSANGSAVGGLYYNWGGKSTGTAKEPDNYGAGQDHAAIGLAGWPSGTTSLGTAGEWNDIIGSSLLYYIVEKNSSVGVNDVNIQNGIKAYPNPCVDKLFVEAQNISHGSRFEIYDLTGKLLIKDKFRNNYAINVRGLNKGFYLLKIGSEVSTFIKFSKE
jgi:hypothetical protein